MISTKKSILYSLSIIISIIIAAILLISKIGNLFMENNIQNKIVFFMIILILILSLLLFIINISLTYTNKKSDLKNNKEQLSEKNNNNTKIEDVNSEKDEIDFNYYSKKFIPTGKYKKDSVKYCEKTLSNIAKELDIVQGLFYLREKGSNDFT
ncbi:MAG: hypothetical protein U9R54_01900, partial [Bacteroidota bacterium]|nr:hypothetical protein [Bacteroidota bacterium]